MIKIVTPEDLQKIQDPEIYPYIRELLFRILKEYANYSPDPFTTDEIGGIFLLEQETDWQFYREMGLSMPIKESRFEFIEQIDGYCNGYIVIDNERTINIIGKQDYFIQFKEAFA